MKKENIVITDSFLPEEQFATLRDTVTENKFPWYFQETKTHLEEDRSISPGQFTHIVYTDNAPCSHYNSYFVPILEQVNPAILTRIKLNLNTRLSEPFYSDFHVDPNDMREDIIARLTTSIFYIHSNNGYTEFEQDGTIVKSVANRLATFPANTRHRGVTQTDEQTRIVINFNYLR